MSFIPRSLAPFERYPNELARLRIALGQQLDSHVELAGRMVAASGQFFLTDMWMMGVAQRSYHLIEGFIQAFDSWNVTVAAPIVRFQIENLYRTDYILTCADGDVVLQLMRGIELRKLRAPDNGKKLTDGELVRRAAERYPWLPDVYAASNKWVHLSERHIFNANRVKDLESRTMQSRVPLPADLIPVSFLQELLDVMREATDKLFECFEAWADLKLEHPDAEPNDLDRATLEPDDED